MAPLKTIFFNGFEIPREASGVVSSINRRKTRDRRRRRRIFASFREILLAREISRNGHFDRFLFLSSRLCAFLKFLGERPSLSSGPIFLPVFSTYIAAQLYYAGSVDREMLRVETVAWIYVVGRPLVGSVDATWGNRRTC